MTIDDGVRDFSPRSKTTEKPTYIEFMLAGEHFHALSEAPAGIMNDLLAGIGLDDAGNRVYQAPNLIRFVQGVLREQEALTPEEATERGIERKPSDDGLVWIPADDLRRFSRVVYGKQHVVKVDELGELVMWLSEKLADRPTGTSGRYARG